MFRVVIPALLAVALTACGGGGGGNATPGADPVVDTTPKLGAVYPYLFSPMIPGHFKADQTPYIVMGHVKNPSPNNYEAGPVKIYQLNNDGTITDATVEILGGAVSAAVGAPLVADFNNDGIDDIFLPGFSDTQDLVPSMAFISRAGRSHIRVDLPDPVWTHNATVFDINGDGYLDVMGSWGEVWMNDGTGNFRFRSHSWKDVPGFWIHGSGVCAGDFNNTGRKQVVLTDQMVDANIGPIADTVIFELNAQGLPTAQHYLPVPILDRGTAVEVSHDVMCQVADVNSDGRPDILVFSRPLSNARNGTWTNEGVVQVLINRGNWQFEDVSDLAMIGYDTNALVSYTAQFIDLNGDGKLDLWSSSFDFGSGKANQVFLNNGAGVFTRTSKDLINTFTADGGMLPVKFGNKWALVFAKMNQTTRTSEIYFTKPLYTFN